MPEYSSWYITFEEGWVCLNNVFDLRVLQPRHVQCSRLYSNVQNILSTMYLHELWVWCWRYRAVGTWRERRQAPAPRSVADQWEGSCTGRGEQVAAACWRSGCTPPPALGSDHPRNSGLVYGNRLWYLFLFLFLLSIYFFPLPLFLSSWLLLSLLSHYHYPFLSLTQCLCLCLPLPRTHSYTQTHPLPIISLGGVI